MNSNIRHTFTYDNMMKLISVYYKGQDRDVRARISSTDEGFSSIKIKEIISDNGVARIQERVMTKDKLDQIITNIFASAGQKVDGIIDYANAGSKVLDNGFEHIVQPDEEKRFIVLTSEIKKFSIR